MPKTFLSDVGNLKCVLYSQNHHLAKCHTYLKLPVNERTDVVKNNKLCFNCLSLHNVISCNCKYLWFCKKRHNRTLNFPKNRYEEKAFDKESRKTMQLMFNETQMGNSNSASGSKDGLLSI